MRQPTESSQSQRFPHPPAAAGRPARRSALVRRALTSLAALTIVALAAAPASAAGDLWLHVHVQEDNGATVRINLPIAFVETAVRAIPEAGADGRIEIDGEDFEIADLRAMWASLGDTGEAVLVDVDDDGDSVQVRKSGGYLLVDVDEREDFGGAGAKVGVRIPERVVEALLSGEGEELDIAGALRALAEAGEGELVTVNDRDARVRVWVDDRAAE